jgi:hypothetical protein
VVAIDSLRFHIRGLKLPITLPPFGHLDVTVDASGEKQDTFYTTVHIVGELLGNTSSLETQVRLIVTREGPVAISLPKSLVVQPTNICNHRLVSIPLANVGCADVICDTIRWVVSSTDITVLHQPAFPRLLHPDEQDSVLLIYHPQRAGTETVMLSWRVRPTKGAPIDTFSLIKLSSYSISRATASVANIQFDSIRICDARDTSFRVYNESCQWTEVVGSTEPLDPSFIATVTKNSWLAPGDSIDIPVALVPVAPGDHTGIVSLFLRDSSGSEQALDVPLSAYITPSLRAWSISSSSVDWVNVDPCSTHDTLITIRNLGVCDTLSVDSLWSGGSNWFRGNLAGPTKLAPGDSTSIQVHLGARDDRSSQGAITVRLSGHDTTIDLTASTLSTGPQLVLEALESTEFEAAYCAAVARRFVVRNRTCQDLTIDSLGVTGDAFAIYPSLNLPRTLRPGASDTIQVVFSAEDTNAHAGDLVACSGGDRASLSLTGLASTRPKSFALGVFAVGATTLLPGELAKLEVRAANDVPDSLGLRRISAHLSIDQDLFRLVSVTPDTNWRLSSAEDAGGISLTFDRPTADATIARGMPMATVTLEAMLSKRQTTECSIEQLTLNDDDSSYKTCILAPASSAFEPLSIRLVCGDSLLMRQMQGLPLTLDNITVQQHGASARIEAFLHSNAEAVAQCQIADVAGRIVFSDERHIQQGTNRLVFEIPGISGSYELVLTSRDSRVSRSFIIVR